MTSLYFKPWKCMVLLNFNLNLFSVAILVIDVYLFTYKILKNSRNSASCFIQQRLQKNLYIIYICLKQTDRNVVL